MLGERSFGSVAQPILQSFEVVVLLSSSFPTCSLASMRARSLPCPAQLSAKADPEGGKFPLKMRDAVIASGLALLKTKGLIPEADESDDDVNYAEAAGVEW